MRYFFLTWLLTGYCYAMSQGCSDAGFCTMGALKPDQTYSQEIDFRIRSIELNYYRGRTLLSPVVTALTADLTFSIYDDYIVQLKLPYQRIRGNLGETDGLGDVSISATRTVLEFPFGTLNATAGFKIPTGNADLQSDDAGFSRDLPMYYQTSLGTFDLVAGASLINNNWLISTGIQMPLIHNNHNDFRWSEWSDYPGEEYIRKHAMANNLRRGTDVMLRIERNWRFVNYNFSLGALPIFRVTRDKVYDSHTDQHIKLDDTRGLALTALASFGYNLNVNNSLKAIYAHKVTARKVNPDGLTRHDVLSLSYIYRF